MVQFNNCIGKKIQAILLEDLEHRLVALKSAHSSAVMPARGWLRAVREAVGLTQGHVAEKAGVKRQSYAQFETAEEKGTITLGSLRRAAEAMDCELVYFVVPKETVATSYSGLIELHDPEARHLKATEHSLSLGGRAVLTQAKPNP
jgi:predicted DNA-binding mobile mystery protein A